MHARDCLAVDHRKTELHRQIAVDAALGRTSVNQSSNVLD
jgi:hypothetical protein